MTAVSVYAVFASAGEAEMIGRIAVEERLAACVNILGSVRSIYRWQNAVEQAEEVSALFKTKESAVEALMMRIAELHSYEVPCIETWAIEHLLPAYGAFVEANVE